MKNSFAAYTGDGNLKMDKTGKSYYFKENQALVIESVFLGNASMKDTMKSYLLEKQYNRMNLDVRSLEYDNDQKNRSVAAPKEACQ